MHATWLARSTVRHKLVLVLAVMTSCWNVAGAMQSPRTALGTSAAVDPQGNVWIVYAEGAASAATVYVSRSTASGAWEAPIAVNATPEPVASDGDNRPKLAFDSQGGMYVTWTSPLAAPFTGNIRFARSLDGGKRWLPPAIVHRDRQMITHRFESMLVDREDTIWVAWIDKRDLEIARAAQRDYAGAAVYYAYSRDRGATWQGDFKLADHTCECCRIGLSLDHEGRPAALWRHVFQPSERDHAFAVLTRDRAQPVVSRATFDRWNVEACPHHGPSLAFGRDGTRHAVWFNEVAGAGRVFYGQLTSNEPTHVKPLPAGASHADVAVAGNDVAVVWKRFDGEATRVESWLSADGGRTFAPGPTLETAGDSDQPRVLQANGDLRIVWRRAEGVATQSLLGDRAAKTTQAARKPPPSAHATQIQPFDRATLQRIERERRGRPFWLVMWDLECTYCMKSLSTIAAAQRAHPELTIVTVTTDPIEQAEAIEARLAQLGVVSDAYAFAAGTPEALRYAIDPAWSGEKPRSYRYDAAGKRVARTGVLTADELTRQ